MGKTYHQGRYIPQHPQKYRGDVNNIIFRSSWERKFFMWCDMNSSVLEWSSEEIVIPYICQTDNKHHRYFLDAHVKIRDSKGNILTYLVEIKPFAQTQPPKFPGKQTKRYLTEAETFIKNQSKWDAAKKFAEKNGVQFIILTEKELGIGRTK